jgi:hypothetical protein
MEKQKSHTLPTQHSPITKHMKRENMCKIDDEFFITTQGKIYFKGQVYELEDCDFNEGAKIVIHYGEKKIEKLLKKDIKIKVIPDQFIQQKEDDMFLSPLDEPIMTAQAQPVQPIHSTVELPPEIDQFEQLMKITKDNTPLALVILIVLMFQKMQKKEREDKDHALVCDFERKDIEKKISVLESKIDAQAKDQARIQVGDDDLADRLDRVEEKIKKISASIP